MFKKIITKQIIHFNIKYTINRNMKKKILIFSPTFNERNNIIQFLNKFRENYNKYDLLIVDDNSPDNTFLVLKLNSRLNKNITIKKRKSKLGLDTVYKYAFKYAFENNYDNLISIDFDLQHNLADIKKIIFYLKNYNFVIGSRYINGGKCNLKGFRYILSFYGNKLIKFILKLPLDEFTTALRGYDKKVIKNLSSSNFSTKGYSFQTEVVNKIYKKQFRVKEFPIIFGNRSSGKSKIPKLESLRTIIYLIKVLFKSYK